MDQQEKHDIASLERRIKDLSAQLKHVADDTDFEELLGIIHKPGFTSVAEYLLVSGIADAMQEHAKALAGLKQVLIDGSRAVGEK